MRGESATQALGNPVQATDLHLNDLNGQFNDEVSILTQLGQQAYQCMPSYSYEELLESNKSYSAKFEAVVKFNAIPIGVGYGPNKDEAKKEACKNALKVIAPKIFEKQEDQEIL